jgi:hypothetical protein
MEQDAGARSVELHVCLGISWSNFAGRRAAVRFARDSDFVSGLETIVDGEGRRVG